MEDLGAAVPRLPAQDAVGHEQEIALVQAADPVPEVAPHQDTGRLQPVDRLCPAVVEVAGLVAADRAGEKRQPAERGAAGQLRHDVREAPRSAWEGAVLVHLTRAARKSTRLNSSH